MTIRTTLLKSLVTLSATAAIASLTNAAVIYDQSFDYGDSTLDFGSDLSGQGWSDNTPTIDYVPSAGLNYTDLAGATGGALSYDFSTDTGDRRAWEAFTADPFTGAAVGTESWVFALGSVPTSITDGETNLYFAAGSIVNEIIFQMTGTGVSISAFDNSSNTFANVASSAFNTDGTTTAFLMQIIQGSGTSPSDSTVNAWINPDLTNLGTPDGTITSKIGRANEAFTTVFYGANNNGAAAKGGAAGTYVWDEVRFTDDFNTIVVPEPSTYAALLGLLALGVVAYRRRKR